MTVSSSVASGARGGGQGISPGRVGPAILTDGRRRAATIGGVDEITALSYPVAFAAGFVSFASPCVLALVPGYLCFISGVTLRRAGLAHA